MTLLEEFPKLSGNRQGRILAEQMDDEDESFRSGHRVPEDVALEGFHKVDRRQC